jgi:hypothetical protein
MRRLQRISKQKQLIFNKKIITCINFSTLESQRVIPK